MAGHWWALACGSGGGGFIDLLIEGVEGSGHGLLLGGCCGGSRGAGRGIHRGGRQGHIGGSFQGFDESGEFRAGGAGWGLGGSSLWRIAEGCLGGGDFGFDGMIDSCSDVGECLGGVGFVQAQLVAGGSLEVDGGVGGIGFHRHLQGCGDG